MAGESRNRHSDGGDEGVVTSGLSSRSSFLIPKRNGFVSVGESCILKTNHFKPLTHWDNLHLYDVSIKVMSCGANRATSSSYGVNRAVMRQLCKKYRQSHLCDRLPAYDGRNRLYSYGPFSFVSETFVITLQDEEDSLDGGQAPQRYGTLFDVTITFNAILTGAIDTEESIQALSTVLRESPIERRCRVGRSFYSPSSEKRHLLGGGLKIWCGFYQSIQHCQMGLSLTIDTSYKAFIEPQPVIEFVDQLLSRKTSDGPLSGDERLKIIKALHGVKVYVTHRGNVRTKYRISGLTSKVTSKLSFPVDNHGTRKTVVQYFQEKYGYVIKHISLPCLQVGNQQRPNYLPIEVCKIAEGQHFREQLNENQLSAFLEVTCQRPIEREQDILKTLKSHNEDAYLKEFGITFDNNLTTVEGRVLPPPYLKFHEGEFLPKVGRWDMRRKKMFKGGVVDSWACINFAWDINDDYAVNFCNELVLMCHVSGMEFSTDPVLPVAACNPKFVELALKEHYKRAMKILGPQGKKLDLLILILPDNNGTLYGEIKRILETDIGLVSQCCLAKHVFIPKKRYLANIVLKINVKVGGKNMVLLDALERKLPRVSNKPTIIFGADVSHPHPREGCSSPSIAAVVASQDWPEITQYAGLVSPQTNRGEIINDLFNEKTGGMVRKHLISFYRETGHKPGRIIFYRDGVSKGQLNHVLDHELAAIKKACASLEPTYNPQVTFVVVQKRHHTRLFSHDYDVGNTVYLSGNVLPGTVIDKEICHPTEFDFYLCSHAGTKGVSRPILYHVLCDENNFTANALQTLTYQLCYTYARCTSSVSIVSPVYYAHLLASRGRHYIKPGQRTECLKKKGGQRAEISFPDIKENVKNRGMFFC